MQIFEAAQKALLEIGEPAHLRELVRHIEAKGYFYFGAKSPEGALGVAIGRRSKGVAISRSVDQHIFYRHKPATYGLLEWLNQADQEDLTLDEQISAASESDALDSTLLLEEDLQNWLFRNLEQNGLTALTLGTLRLVEARRQAPMLGKFNTSVVGEIDMLLQTTNGDYVVIELKRGSSDRTVGQICRYVGWVMENLAEPGRQRVFGVIVAREVNEHLRLAVKAASESIRYCTLNIETSLSPLCR
jgi:hypothetical protein